MAGSHVVDISSTTNSGEGDDCGRCGMGVVMALRVISSAFSENDTIPQKYTCDGQNVSPPLEWSGEPPDTKSLAVICDDPDAPSGTFTHWVLYDVPGSAHRLSEGSRGIGSEGRNSFKHTGFGGPCPPPKDGPHRYVFQVYALDLTSLGKPGLSREDVATAMQGHVLAEGQLTARYARYGRANSKDVIATEP